MQQHTSIVKRNCQSLTHPSTDTISIIISIISQGYSSSYLFSGLSLALNKIQLWFAVVDTHLL